MSNDSSSPKLMVPAVAGLYEWGSGISYPLIRLFTGLMLVPHGAQKLFDMFGGTTEGTAAFFTKVGVEPALTLTYLVGFVEFFGGIMIAIGLLTRPAALGAMILLLVAVFQVHLGNGFFWTKVGYEYPLYWAVMCFAVFLKGGGNMSVDSKLGKEF